MTNPSDAGKYPAPRPERVERALRAMRARRTRLRRFRIAAVSSALVVVAAVAILATQISPTSSPRLRVEGQPSTSTHSAPSTTAAPTSTTSSTATSTTSTPTTAVPGSREITYQPFTAAGVIDPGLHVTASVTGTCISGEVKRAYRCFGTSPAGGIYDPCFVGPQGTTAPLACPLNPAAGDIVEFSVTSVTSQAPVTTTRRPWAMQLSGGQVCLFVSAAWGGLGPYDCQFNNASATPADCRQPQPSQPWWTAECQDQKSDASPFTTNTVRTLWF
jgi:hypothetical protein